MKRVLTSLFLIPFIAYVVCLGPQWLLLAVLAVIGLLCYAEFSDIIAGHGIERPGMVGYAACLLVLFAPHELVVVGIVTLAAMTLALGAKDLRMGLSRAAALLLGVIYIFGAWRCAVDLRAISVHWLLFGLALTWAGDIAAYYVGRMIGRHKLAPRISPGKSWEGAVASVLGSILFGVLYLGRFLPEVPWPHVVALAALGNIAGQIGDLCESAMKRGAGMKDSGKFLPGHGGWLDRVDSSLFALPVVYFFLRTS